MSKADSKQGMKKTAGLYDFDTEKSLILPSKKLKYVVPSKVKRKKRLWLTKREWILCFM